MWFGIFLVLSENLAPSTKGLTIQPLRTLVSVVAKLLPARNELFEPL